MLKTIFVDGDKGGVGKTTVARAIADAYIQCAAPGMPANCKVICLDADHTNPDFCGPGGFETDAKVYETGLIDLDEPKSWLELVNSLEPFIEMSKQEEVRIIISMPATAKRAFEDGSEEVAQILTMLNAVPIWVMGRTEDSVTQLQKRYEAMPKQYEHGLAVVNLFFGTRDRFVIWDSSATRKDLVSFGDWKEVDLPEMSDLVVAKLGRTPYHRAITTGLGANGVRLGMGDIIGIRAFSSRAGSALSVIEQLGDEK